MRYCEVLGDSKLCSSTKNKKLSLILPKKRGSFIWGIYGQETDRWTNSQAEGQTVIIFKTAYG